MFWIGVAIGLFAGTLLGLVFGGLLAAAGQGDDLLALMLAQQEKRQNSPSQE
jgi:hypothetical protein